MRRVFRLVLLLTLFLSTSIHAETATGGKLAREFAGTGMLNTTLIPYGKLAQHPDQNIFAVVVAEKDDHLKFAAFDDKGELKVAPTDLPLTGFPQGAERIYVETALPTRSGILVVTAFTYSRTFKKQSWVSHGFHLGRILWTGEWDKGFGGKGAGIIFNKEYRETFKAIAETVERKILLGIERQVEPEKQNDVTVVTLVDETGAALKKEFGKNGEITLLPPARPKGVALKKINGRSRPDTFELEHLVGKGDSAFIAVGEYHHDFITSVDAQKVDYDGTVGTARFNDAEMHKALGKFDAIGASRIGVSERGGIYVAGWYLLRNDRDLKRDVYVAKLDSEFRIDDSFGKKGVVTIPSQGPDFPFSFPIQELWVSDERSEVVVADARAIAEKDSRRLVVKKWSDRGEPAKDFGRDGMLVPRQAEAGHYRSVTLDRKGKVIVAGMPLLEPDEESRLRLTKYAD